jgi:transcriptional regulator with XRE-family HTH domain
MKNELRTLTGITQEDIAMLFGITRTTWSMHEIGHRDLPTPAMLLLGDILIHLHTNAPKRTREAKASAQSFKRAEKMLNENTYQLVTIQRKIEGTTKMQQQQAHLRLLAEFLKTQKTGEMEAVKFSGSILAKAALIDEAQMESDLDALQYRQEVLLLEKSLLEAKIKKLKDATPSK